MTTNRILVAAATALATGAAAAQLPDDGRLVIDFEGSGIVSPSDPVATLRLWATWDPGPFKTVFLNVQLDLVASEPALENAVPVINTASTWGAPGPLAYRGARFAQIHIPPIGLFGNPDNPILLGTIDWRTTDFTARSVDVRTENETDYEVYASGVSHALPLSPITSGEAVITVIPCYADCDGSTTLDIFDFLCFQDAFIAGEPYADCDGNNTFDIFDFLCFQDAFVTGCP